MIINCITIKVNDDMGSMKRVHVGWIQNGFISKTMTRGQSFQTISDIPLSAAAAAINSIKSSEFNKKKRKKEQTKKKK